MSILIGLLGCESAPPSPQNTDPAANAQQAAPATIDPVLLRKLLVEADSAIQADHLTYPETGSAYAKYLEILAIEPTQQDAIRGLEHIVEQYIELAIQALDRKQYATARSMLARGRMIVPDHPSIKPTDEQIRLLSKAQRTQLRLPQEDLDNNAETISTKLQALANTPDEQSCRFIISAKSDAQGRWIYQALSKGAADARIRAQIKIRLPAGVERLCFQI